MKILALGTSCVDLYPQKNIVTPGGEALNISAHLSRRDDVDVYLMGQIGQDAYGDAILKSIKGMKIDLCHLYRVSGETAHHEIHIKKDGDRYFEEGSWHGGVSPLFRFNDSDRRLIANVDGVITTLWEPNLDELVEMRGELGFVLAVDFNEQRDFGRWEHLIHKLDIFFISAEKSLIDDFRKRSQGCDTVFILTFGEEGSMAFHRGQGFKCPAVPVDNVVDTTGCGDCFQGVFLADYIKNGNISIALEKSSVEAAKVTAYVGGFETR